ncbi:MAG: DUF1611 domain-containing protein [Gemmatimonadaceae bacterium]|nr:DUF1611 domain-containing protein [Gemmatimonadaceae bacterium]
MSITPRYLILAEGAFGVHTSKTAVGCIRFTPEQVVGVLDTVHAGRTVQDVLGFGGAIPVVASVAAGMALQPNILLIGIAPAGGRLPEAWRPVLRAAIEAGLHVWSGLHVFIGDDPEFRELASRHGVNILDVRKPPADLPVSSGRVRDVDATVVLTVGSDCNIGKMTTQLAVRDALKARGFAVAFAGTGQTGIFIDGKGVSVDAVVADFVGGAAESLVLDAAPAADIVLVEGQGSLLHPGFSGVTMGLIHGSLPHALVLCTQPSRTAIRNNEWVKIPSLKALIELHDAVTRPLRHAPTIAIAMNTFDLDDTAARDAIERGMAETRLPVTDPVRFDPAPIVDAIVAAHIARLDAGG